MIILIKLCYIYIFPEITESYIKDIFKAVIIIVLPLFYISVVLLQDKESVFPNMYLLIVNRFIVICQRKGKVIFKWKQCLVKLRASMTVALRFLGV